MNLCGNHKTLPHNVSTTSSLAAHQLQDLAADKIFFTGVLGGKGVVGKGLGYGVGLSKGYGVGSAGLARLGGARGAAGLGWYNGLGYKGANRLGVSKLGSRGLGVYGAGTRGYGTRGAGLSAGKVLGGYGSAAGFGLGAPYGAKW